MSPHSVPTLSNSPTGLWVTGVAKRQLSQWEKTTPHGHAPLCPQSRLAIPDMHGTHTKGGTETGYVHTDSSSVFSLVKLWCSQASLFPLPCSWKSDLRQSCPLQSALRCPHTQVCKLTDPTEHKHLASLFSPLQACLNPSSIVLCHSKGFSYSLKGCKPKASRGSSFWEFSTTIAKIKVALLACNFAGGVVLHQFII